MYRLFGIPNCDTVKKARTYLEKKKIEYQFIDFKKIKPGADDIERWTKAFGGVPVNTKGTTYKKLKDEYLGLSDKLKFSFIAENSSMINRPILEKNGEVLSFGFDESEYQKVIK